MVNQTPEKSALADQILSTFNFLPDTSDWTTYQNSKYGFTLKFPSKFAYKNSDSDSFQPGALPGIIGHLVPTQVPELSYPDFGISVARTDLSPDAWIKSENLCPDWPTQPSCQPVIPGPISGSLQITALNRHYASVDTFVKKDRLLFDLSLTYRNPNQPLPNPVTSEYNAILSTFKFTDLISGTSTWKNYQNSTYHFSFSYPPNFDLLTPGPHDLLPLGFISVCDGSKDLVCLHLPPSAYPNTNFEGAGVAVSYLLQLTSPASCSTTNLMGQITATQINGIGYWQSTIGNGATGHTGGGPVYRTFNQNKCFEIQLSIDKYRDELSRSFTSTEESTLSSVLTTILSTFKFEK